MVKEPVEEQRHGAEFVPAEWSPSTAVYGPVESWRLLTIPQPGGRQKVAHGASRGVGERGPVSARRAALRAIAPVPKKCRPPGCQRLFDLPTARAVGYLLTPSGLKSRPFRNHDLVVGQVPTSAAGCNQGGWRVGGTNGERRIASGEFRMKRNFSLLCSPFRIRYSPFVRPSHPRPLQT